MCETLGISKSTYYKYKDTVDRDYEDFIKINEVFERSQKTYGFRRIKKALLKEYNLNMNLKKVRRIQKKYDLKVKYQKIYKKKSRQEFIEENVQPNMLNREFTAKKPNEKWSVDITYITGKRKRKYLFAILDLYTKKIVEYGIDSRMDISLIKNTLMRAIRKYEPKELKGLIIHSDQGTQFTSNIYKNICESNNIQISMSQKGTPADNAPIESFFSSLKRETIHSTNYVDIEQMIEDIKEWIKFYNTDRIRIN